ncbi:MAG: peptidoglycan-binding protein [Clostridia bacterium]|nr:peptidoglycan-binding protein [Clostridia bacterium]
MKNVKVIKRMGFVLLMVCVLALSGCYANTPTIEGTTGNLFPEYPTQNVSVNAQSPAPSNVPEIGNQGNNGVVMLPTSAPQATVNVINQQTPVVLATSTVPPLNAGVSPVPQPVLITTDAPTATPSNILKLGATGAAVKDLQQKLKALGYLKGSADGDFGEMTEAAVKAFQQQMGLEVDGVAGIDTLRKLASTTVTAKPNAVVTPVPAVTSKPQYGEDTYLQVGSSGSLVTKMQTRLIQLGYLSGEATGRFDEATESAVIAFQKRNCSYWDGIAGKLTLDVLFSSSAKGTSTSAGMVGASLKVGSQGNEVRSLQSRLKELGYYTGSVDGDFGSSTEEAVKAFQRNNGLTADGKAGSETITKLNSSSAKKANSGTGSNASQVLELGSQGAEVVELQSRLKKLGYYTGNVDGDFGDSTRLAVRAFQQNNGLTVDGRVGAGTADVLYSSSAKAAGEDVLEIGSRGDEVIALQNRLKKLGYYSGNVDGDFGESTRLAVRAFQKNNGLTVDGRVGAGTSAKLFSSSAKSATPKPTAKPTQAPSATLEMGSTGERVVRLQSRLKTLGYYNGVVDGDFGAATRDAVRAFQRQNGLTVDGRVGQTTWDKINGNSKTAAPSTVTTPVPENVYVLVTPAPDGTYVTLQRGHYGSLVRELQQELKDQGYFTGTVDGYFGESTEIAVKKLQRAKGLQEDGKAGQATQRVLFEGDYPFGA